MKDEGKCYLITYHYNGAVGVGRKKVFALNGASALRKFMVCRNAFDFTIHSVQEIIE